MSDEASLHVVASVTKNGITLAKDFTFTADVAGNTPLSTVQNIGTADETLVIGDITTPGFLICKNLAEEVTITTPTAPTVVTHGAAGAATWTYKIVARQGDDIYSAASGAGSVSTGNATLDSTNYNVLTWPAVPGATSYDIYRTAHGTSPSTDGLIANTTSNTYNDQGAAGDSSSPPTDGIDNVILFGEDGSSYPDQLAPGQAMLVHWNGTDIHAKGNTAACDLEYLVLPK